MTEKDLKRFIIRGFVRTAILVAVVEFIMLFVIINVLIPILIDEFFPYIYDITSFKELWDLPSSTKWVILMMMLGTFIISVLPLTAGAVIFSGRVTRKFKVYEAEREAERASVQKQRYLMISDIAHDLKTPMTTVSGYAKALADGMVREDQETEYLEAIRDKTLRMNDIVQMLFDYVRLDSEGFTIAKKRTDICELVRECVASYYSDIETSGDEAEIDIPDEVMEALETVVFPPFTLRLGGFGNFGDLWWAGVGQSDELKACARKVRHTLAQAGIPYDRKRFSPHITLIRRAVPGPRGMPGAEVPPVAAELHRVSLMRSDRGRNGMLYTEVGAVSF